MQEGLQFLTSTSVTTVLFASLLSLSTPSNPTLSIQTPLKNEGGTNRLLFLNPRVEQVFFRGTVRVRCEDEQEQTQRRYVHLVQRRGQPGEPLVRLNLLPGARQEVQVDFMYPPDSTPPQVLTLRTEG